MGSETRFCLLPDDERDCGLRILNEANDWLKANHIRLVVTVQEACPELISKFRNCLIF